MRDNNPFQQVLVTNIQVKDTAGRSGADRTLDPAMRGVDFEEFTVQNITDDLLSFIGLRDDRFQLIYTMEVMASNERSAKSKARMFVRAKNPFEPRTTFIKSEGIAYSSSIPLMDVYTIVANLEKR